MYLTRAKAFAKDYSRRHFLTKVKSCPVVLSKAGIALHVEVFYEDSAFNNGIAIVLSVPHKKDYSVVSVKDGKMVMRLAL